MEKDNKSFKDSLKVILKPKSGDIIDKKDNITENEIEIKSKYGKLIEYKRDQFLAFIHYLNTYINKLKAENVISPYLVYRARIKATKSALENYGKKEVNDVFGIEFICATESEIKILKQEIENLLLTYKEKKLRKDNGYRALHCSCSMNEELINELNSIFMQKGIGMKEIDSFPKIEIQYKTVEVDYNSNFGTASHEKYKNAEIMELQKLYDDGKMVLGEDIPYMWVSSEESNEMKELSMEEILKKVFPSLKLRENNKSADEKTETEKIH